MRTSIALATVCGTLAATAGISDAAGPTTVTSGVASGATKPPSTTPLPQLPKPAPAKRASVPPSPPSRYVQAVKSWHTPVAGKKPSLDAHGRPLLVLNVLNTGERMELSAVSDDGAFTSRDLDRVAHLLREPSSASEHPVEPRLLDVLYRIQRNFNAQEIRLVSGFRVGRSAAQRGPIHAAGSNHSYGRAADIVVPGARDEDVAKFAREIGFVGVGIYPISGFVHVDVRGRSYFWVDKSGPGRRNRERGVLADLAKKSDARALARGEHPTGSFNIGIAVESLMDDRPDTDATDDDDDV